VRYWLALPLLAFATPALADWQYTRWGMSVDEVLAASNGSASKVRDDKDKRVRKLPRLALGTVKEGDTEFTVEFFFEKKKLRFLRYVPKTDLDCDSEERLLLDRFGAVEPVHDQFEFPGRNLVLGKSRKLVWNLPGNDQLKFDIIWFERPDLSNVKSKRLCSVLIEAKPPAGQPS
jgi:hypothetical protein